MHETTQDSAAPRARQFDKSKVTIYDIAREAGVNPSTVSRALAKPGRVSIATEKVVRETARKLDYRVNPIARALPTGRTRTIGLIVADITNPVFFDVVRGTERTAEEQDYTMVLAESEESTDTERRAAERLLQSVDGLVFATARMADSDLLQLAESKPVVLINREVNGVASVLVDVEPGIVEAVRHLKSLRHTRIAYVLGPEQSWISARRLACIRHRCSWANIAVETVRSGSPTIEGGRNVAHQLHGMDITGVIAYNDLLAIGLMHEMQEAGVMIPRDLSIVGFDNIFGSDFTSPQLTTITSPLHEAGAHAFNTLVNLLDRVVPGPEGAAATPVSLHSKLVIRGSTGLANF